METNIAVRRFGFRQVRRAQKGVGIIEVLVALVVVSFGVLGMASLQLTGMKHSTGGLNRSKALLFSQSMAARIRMNSIAVANTVYAGMDSGSVNCAIPPAPYCQATAAKPDGESCSPAELAVFDLYAVSCGGVANGSGNTGVLGTLPDGNINIACLSSPCRADSVYQVNVTWSEGRARTNSDEFVNRRVQVRLKP